MGACNCTSIARSIASSLADDYCNEHRRESMSSFISGISSSNKRELCNANLSVSAHSSLGDDEPSSKLLSPPLTPTKVPQLRCQTDYNSVGNLAEIHKSSLFLTPQMARRPRRNSFGEKNSRERKDICIFVTEPEPAVTFTSGKYTQPNEPWVADFDQPQALGKSSEQIVCNGKPSNSTSATSKSPSGKPIQTRGSCTLCHTLSYSVFHPANNHRQIHYTPS